MKIKKFNEKHLHHVYSDEVKPYESYFNKLISRFLEIKDIAHSELFKDIIKDNIIFSLIIEFHEDSLNSDSLVRMSNYIKYLETNATYKFFTGDEVLGIEARFNDYEKFEDELKLLIDSNKYNL